MNIIFAGTSEFAVASLLALIDSEHKIVAVYTPPDRPAGRGLKLTPSPIKQVALENNIPIYQPLTLKTLEVQKELEALNADLIVVAAYGLLIPKAVLNLPRYGCINIHPSLLPRWRGAAPIVRTIEYGDVETGVTIMQLDEGLDTGPIWMQQRYTVLPDETSQSLYEKLSPISATLLLKTIGLLKDTSRKPIPQSDEKVTYAEKINRDEARLDWALPVVVLERKVRAFNPWPGAYTIWNGDLLKIWEAKAVYEKSVDALELGSISAAHEDSFDIRASDGFLRVYKVQLPGKKIMSVKDFLVGNRKYLTG